MRIVTGTITNEEHIRYPCVVYLRLTVTISGVNKQIDNTLLSAFISLTDFISLRLVFLINYQFTL
jgi:hypothetical protein